MKRTIHAAAAALAITFIATFWIATVIAEAFLSNGATATVKSAIAVALIPFIPTLITAGVTGMALGAKSADPLVRAKRRRMPFIALNGLLVLVPAALFLAARAQAGSFDPWFYAVQGVELLVGAVNLTLMGLNIRDGRRLTARRADKAMTEPAS